MDFFLELLTYDCPYTGKKRCAVDASLAIDAAPKQTLWLYLHEDFDHFYLYVGLICFKHPILDPCCHVFFSIKAVMRKKIVRSIGHRQSLPPQDQPSVHAEGYQTPGQNHSDEGPHQSVNWFPNSTLYIVFFLLNMLIFTNKTIILLVFAFGAP